MSYMKTAAILLLSTISTSSFALGADSLSFKATHVTPNNDGSYNFTLTGTNYSNEDIATNSINLRNTKRIEGMPSVPSFSTNDDGAYLMTESKNKSLYFDTTIEPNEWNDGGISPDRDFSYQFNNIKLKDSDSTNHMLDLLMTLKEADKKTSRLFLQVNLESEEVLVSEI